MFLHNFFRLSDCSLKVILFWISLQNTQDQYKINAKIPSQMGLMQHAGSGEEAEYFNVKYSIFQRVLCLYVQYSFSNTAKCYSNHTAIFFIHFHLLRVFIIPTLKSPNIQYSLCSGKRYSIFRFLPRLWLASRLTATLVSGLHTYD